jgi:hypothetical protein
MKKTLRVAAVAALGLALWGCESTKINPTAGGGGLAGEWKPTEGNYTASFDNGTFTTTALDTGGIISQGSYVAISEKEVDLNWQSNVTGTANSARCQRPDPNTLVCADGGGRGFTLRRA